MTVEDHTTIIAAIARQLAASLLARARSRSAEDARLVAVVQTELCAAVAAEAAAANGEAVDDRS